jgi:hypothetical protein
MNTRTKDRSVDQAIAAIQALDLHPIRLRVMDKESGEGWTREYAETIEQAYRAYLTMLVKHPEDAEDIVVSRDVDEFWHAHILHTMKYTEDCEKVFGTYLHHNPHVGERTQADVERKAAQVDKTRRMYQEEFGASQARDIAWCGGTLESTNAPWCGAEIKSKAAWCGATTKPAWCGAELKGASWCGASVKMGKAAWCGATTRPAWCGAELKGASWCGANIKTGKAAWCGAATKTAWCGAELKGASWCGASIKTGKAAWCGAATKTSQGCGVAMKA